MIRLGSLIEATKLERTVMMTKSTASKQAEPPQNLVNLRELVLMVVSLLPLGRHNMTPMKKRRLQLDQVTQN